MTTDGGTERQSDRGTERQCLRPSVPPSLRPSVLLVLLLLAALPRLASVGFNAWPHGDVLLDAAIVDSLVERGELEVPLVDVRYYPIGRFGFGYPPDQHPPLLPLLGAAVRLAWPDSYEALKLVSLLAGLLLLPAVYLCGRDLFGHGPALYAAALCATSYLLIDFSGNGSLWILLALLYVLFAWRSGAFPLRDPRNAILLGLLMAAGYLTNYPAIVLPVTYLALLVWLQWTSPKIIVVGAGQAPPASSGGASTATRIPTESLDPARATSPRHPHAPDGLRAGRADQPSPQLPVPPSPRPRVAPSLPPSRRPSVRTAALPLLVAALVALPWLAFNLATFGNPVWSQPLERQLGGGDKRVEVVVQDGEVVKRSLPGGDPLGERLRTTAYNLYGNVGFLVRQSFALLPFLGGFCLAGLLALMVRAWRGQAGRALPLLLLTLAHGALILLWPTTKFRYLVPLFPLVALIGSWLLWQVKPADLRNLLAAVALGLTVFTSAWTFASIPSHTYYYDGGLVEDNFGAQGEIAYVEELRSLEPAAAAIRAAGPGPVLGPHPLYAQARQPLVVSSPAYSREVVEALVRRYGVRYVVDEPRRLAFYAAFLPGRVLWQDDRFAVYRLEP